MILEYNEKQGVWHFNDGRRAENTNGWRTVSEQIEENLANEFCNYMEFLDPRIGAFNNPNHKPPYPTYHKIMIHFKSFIKNKPTVVELDRREIKALRWLLDQIDEFDLDDNGSVDIYEESKVYAIGEHYNHLFLMPYDLVALQRIKDKIKR